MDEEVKRIKEIFKRRQAKRWFSDARRLERKTPSVAEDINHYLATGELPDNLELWTVIEDFEYCQKINAEDEAKKTEIRAKKEAKASNKSGRLTTNQRARLIK